MVGKQAERAGKQMDQIYRRLIRTVTREGLKAGSNAT